jgi:hypothetical protein
MTDQTEEPTAYTYEDAARLCGVSTETIRLRARRGKLGKGRPTNTNRPTVLLTAADIEAISAGRSINPRPSGRPDDLFARPSGQDGRPDGQNSEIKALTDHVTTLQESLKREQTVTDKYRHDLEREQVRTEDAERRAQAATDGKLSAEQERDEARGRVNYLTSAVDQLRKELSEAHQWERDRQAAEAERDQVTTAALDAEPDPEPAKGWRAWRPWKR